MNTRLCAFAYPVCDSVCADVRIALTARSRDAGRVNGGRVGTLYATRAELVAALGHGEPGCDDKTGDEFYFRTPYGPAAMWDYWMSAPGEWSIIAESEEAAACVSATVNRLLGRAAEPYIADTREAFAGRVASFYATARAA